MLSLQSEEAEFDRKALHSNIGKMKSECTPTLTCVWVLYVMRFWKRIRAYIKETVANICDVTGLEWFWVQIEKQSMRGALLSSSVWPWGASAI